jgi:predicted alpha/beta superfamily hydrolase
MKKNLLVIVILLSSLSVLGQHFERYKKLIDTTLHSRQLGFDKHIAITVPKEWQKNSDRKFPVIVVFDSQNPRSHQYILNTIDYLTSNEQMPSSVIVSIESTDDYRVFETLHKVSDPKGLETENERFLFDELIPLLEKDFKASPFRVLIGHSRYGYFTTALLTRRIHELNAVIAISPFFKEENVDLIDSLAALKNEKLTHQTFFRYSAGLDFPNHLLRMDSLMITTVIDKLDTKGVLFQSATHNVTPGLSVGTALYELFEEWAKQQNTYLDITKSDTSLDSAVASFKQTISNFYGHELVFSLGALNGKGWYFYGEEQYAKAIEAWEVLLKFYPSFSEGYLSILDAQQHLKINYSGTAEKFKVSLAESDFYTEKEKTDLMLELKELTK